MTQTQHSTNTLDAIEQAIPDLPNSSVVKKLNILSIFSSLKTEELAKVMGWQILSLLNRSETFEIKYACDICRIGVRQPIIFRCQMNFNMHQF